MEQENLLVKQAQQGDVHAFAQLYECCYRDLYRFALYNLGQEEDVSTVGVKAVLLASDSVSAEVVEELTALLFEEQQELDFALPVELITDADAAVAGISVPFHKGAERYYESRGEKSEN